MPDPLEVILIGIGTGNPEHMTLQAIRALNRADVVLLPRKGAEKGDLAALRRSLFADVVSNPATRMVEFDMPVRDASIHDYLARVDDWHDAIARAWQDALSAYPDTRAVALMVWGDPALYDSTLRIAGRLGRPARITVIPGIMAPQALTAAHAIPLNAVGEPFLVTTGRRLREEGWPEGVETLLVMLDGDCAFRTLDPRGVTIWWGAFLGMANQIVYHGPLAEAGPRIAAARAAARAEHGWIMDTYLLRRHSASAP
ncbi:precorrin-6A synthase (deacetylating) [Haematobacter genomosp. 1]|uniref:Precorrin-6A synthase [deacetylating] n=1 Tax=Haematobacter genomosp. 1 TaxID=366618 RepID=A0A212ADX7_9RHOB|nr:precorrin-6A synthase (deacetylating) [Haematobacter genomosp. 1]OWJ79414.1 precorrin-6A synthase (deacetylating) [Haematobacter genomosp. 1]